MKLSHVTVIEKKYGNGHGVDQGGNLVTLGRHRMKSCKGRQTDRGPRERERDDDDEEEEDCNAN